MRVGDASSFFGGSPSRKADKSMDKIQVDKNKMIDIEQLIKRADLGHEKINETYDNI